MPFGIPGSSAFDDIPAVPGGVAAPTLGGAVTPRNIFGPHKGPPPPGQPAQQPGTGSWMDLTQPGPAEQMWGATGANWFTAPTNTQSAYNTYSPIFQNLATQPGPTYAADAFGDFQGVPSDAGLGRYYDRAWEQGSERLNRQLGARGAFNSGAAIDAQREFATGLGAEEANRSADFALRRAATEGQLAQGASSEALSGRNSQLSAAQTGSALAGDADSAALQKILGGFGAGQIAQGAHEGRIGDAFNRINGVATEQINTLLPQMMANLEAHADMVDKPFELQMALAQAQMNGDQAQANNILSLLGVGVNAFSKGGPFG